MAVQVLDVQRLGRLLRPRPTVAGLHSVVTDTLDSEPPHPAALPRRAGYAYTIVDATTPPSRGGGQRALMVDELPTNTGHSWSGPGGSFWATVRSHPEEHHGRDPAAGRENEIRNLV